MFGSQLIVRDQAGYIGLSQRRLASSGRNVRLLISPELYTGSGQTIPQIDIDDHMITRLQKTSAQWLYRRDMRPSA